MQSDFSQGKVWKNVINQAIPLMVAQLIQILYNVVDRIYIGHLPVIGSNALTGIGLVFPITTLVAARMRDPRRCASCGRPWRKRR